jgi:hypothetical protein
MIVEGGQTTGLVADLLNKVSELADITSEFDNASVFSIGFRTVI